MIGSWWKAETELIPEQREILLLEPDEDCLVTGPPGSGKTNLVVLRAKYLLGLARHNIAVVVFTRSLCNFIAAGSSAYSLPQSLVLTERLLHMRLLNSQGVELPNSSGSFGQTQDRYLDAIERLIEANDLEDYYDTLLLDEAQDYSERSLSIFRCLAKHLFAVADVRQRIHAPTGALSWLRDEIEQAYALEYNHRNGRKICAVADGIFPQGYLEENSQYNESRMKSSVTVHPRMNDAESLGVLVERLRLQIVTYRREFIGVLCPKREQADEAFTALKQSEIGDFVMMGGSSGVQFTESLPVVVSTVHSAKGLEFRAVHMLHAESFRGRGAKNLAYTAVTRAKTALDIYRGSEIEPFLQQAVAAVLPKPEKPSIGDLLKGD